MADPAPPSTPASSKPMQQVTVTVKYIRERWRDENAFSVPSATVIGAMGQQARVMSRVPILAPTGQPGPDMQSMTFDGLHLPASLSLTAGSLGAASLPLKAPEGGMGGSAGGLPASWTATLPLCSSSFTSQDARYEICLLLTVEKSSKGKGGGRGGASSGRSPLALVLSPASTGTGTGSTPRRAAAGGATGGRGGSTTPARAASSSSSGSGDASGSGSGAVEGILARRRPSGSSMGGSSISSGPAPAPAAAPAPPAAPHPHPLASSAVGRPPLPPPVPQAPGAAAAAQAAGTGTRTLAAEPAAAVDPLDELFGVMPSPTPAPVPSSGGGGGGAGVGSLGETTLITSTAVNPFEEEEEEEEAQAVEGRQEDESARGGSVPAVVPPAVVSPPVLASPSAPAPLHPEPAPLLPHSSAAPVPPVPSAAAPGVAHPKSTGRSSTGAEQQGRSRRSSRRAGLGPDLLPTHCEHIPPVTAQGGGADAAEAVAKLLQDTATTAAAAAAASGDGGGVTPATPSPAMPCRLVDYFCVMVSSEVPSPDGGLGGEGDEGEGAGGRGAGGAGGGGLSAASYNKRSSAGGGSHSVSDDGGDDGGTAASSRMGRHRRMGKMQYRYPKADHADFPLPPNVDWFTFPDGISPILSVARPQLRRSAFQLLTNVGGGSDGAGERVYGVCLTVYRLEDEAGEVVPLPPTGTGAGAEAGAAAAVGIQRTWWPVVLYFLTRLPLIPSLATVLSHVYHVYDGGMTSGEAEGAGSEGGPNAPPPYCTLQEYLRMLVYETPVPVRRARLGTSIFLPGSAPVPSPAGMASFYLPPPTHYQPLQFHPKGLTTLLPPKQLMAAVAAAALSRRMVVIAPTVQELVEVCDGVAGLLFPLPWDMPYIPVLPAHMAADCLQAPVPFMYGLLPSYAASALAGLVGSPEGCDLIIVDACRGEVHAGVELYVARSKAARGAAEAQEAVAELEAAYALVERGQACDLLPSETVEVQRLLAWPAPLAREVQGALEQLLAAAAQQGGGTGTATTTVEAAAAVQTLFLSAWCCVLHGYRSCVFFPGLPPQRTPLMLREAWVQGKVKGVLTGAGGVSKEQQQQHAEAWYTALASAQPMSSLLERHGEGRLLPFHSHYAALLAGLGGAARAGCGMGTPSLKAMPPSARLSLTQPWAYFVVPPSTVPCDPSSVLPYQAACAALELLPPGGTTTLGAVTVPSPPPSDKRKKKGGKREEADLARRWPVDLLCACTGLTTLQPSLVPQMTQLIATHSVEQGKMAALLAKGAAAVVTVPWDDVGAPMPAAPVPADHHQALALITAAAASAGSAGPAAPRRYVRRTGQGQAQSAPAAAGGGAKGRKGGTGGRFWPFKSGGGGGNGAAATGSTGEKGGARSDNKGGSRGQEDSGAGWSMPSGLSEGEQLEFAVHAWLARTMVVCRTGAGWAAPGPDPEEVEDILASPIVRAAFVRALQAQVLTSSGTATGPEGVLAHHHSGGQQAAGGPGRLQLLPALRMGSLEPHHPSPLLLYPLPKARLGTLAAACRILCEECAEDKQYMPAVALAQVAGCVVLCDVGEGEGGGGTATSSSLWAEMHTACATLRASPFWEVYIDSARAHPSPSPSSLPALLTSIHAAMLDCGVQAGEAKALVARAAVKGGLKGEAEKALWAAIDGGAAAAAAAAAGGGGQQPAPANNTHSRSTAAPPDALPIPAPAPASPATVAAPAASAPAASAPAPAAAPAPAPAPPQAPTPPPAAAPAPAVLPAAPEVPSATPAPAPAAPPPAAAAAVSSASLPPAPPPPAARSTRFLWGSSRSKEKEADKEKEKEKGPAEGGTTSAAAVPSATTSVAEGAAAGSTAASATAAVASPASSSSSAAAPGAPGAPEAPPAAPSAVPAPATRSASFMWGRGAKRQGEKEKAGEEGGKKGAAAADSTSAAASASPAPAASSTPAARAETAVDSSSGKGEEPPAPAPSPASTPTYYEAWQGLTQAAAEAAAQELVESRLNPVGIDSRPPSASSSAPGGTGSSGSDTPSTPAPPAATVSTLIARKGGMPVNVTKVPPPAGTRSILGGRGKGGGSSTVDASGLPLPRIEYHPGQAVDPTSMPPGEEAYRPISALFDPGHGLITSSLVLVGHTGGVPLRGIGSDVGDGRLATAGNDGKVSLWDTRARRHVGTYAEASAAISAVKIAGDVVASGSQGGSVRLSSFCRLSYGLDSEADLDGVGRGRGGILGFGAKPMQHVSTPCKLRGHVGPVQSLDLWEKPRAPAASDGAAAGSGGGGGGLFGRRKNADEPPPLLPAESNYVVLSGGADGTVRAWTADWKVSRSGAPSGSAIEIAAHTNLHGRGVPVDSVRLSVDGRLAVSAGRDGRIGVADLAVGKLWIMMNPSAASAKGNGGLFGRGGGGSSASTAGSEPGEAWDASKPSTLPVVTARVDVLRRPITVTSAGADGVVRCWDLRSGGVLAAFASPSPCWGFEYIPAHGLASAEVGPQGEMITPPSILGDTFLASVHEDGLLRIWDARRPDTPRTVLQGAAPGAAATSIATLGDTMVTGSSDGGIRVWDAPTGRGLVFPGHSAPVSSVALFPAIAVSYLSHAAIVVSSSWDGTVRQTFATAGLPNAQQ